MCVGLRRLVFLKRCPDMYREDMVQGKVKPTIFNGFTYVLLCECFNLKAEIIASVCTTIDQLRARCCGYSALYLTHYRPPRGGGQEGEQMGQQHPGGGHQGALHNNHAPSTSGHQQQHQQQQQQHQFHHVPRHHRSTDFSDFDNH